MSQYNNLSSDIPTMDKILDKYNIFLSIQNKSNYPFNLIDNLKDNIIETKKEIELEYYKDFILKESSDIKKGSDEHEILIYLY